MKKATAKGQVVPMGAKPFPKCRKFFVRGLPPDAGDEDIRAFFARAGEVEVADVRWMTDKETGGFRGSALVELANTRQADMAASLHGQKLLGFAARLEWTA
jgi:nucleolin